VRRPPSATLKLGGEQRDEACSAYIEQRRAEVDESQQGVWVGAWLSNDRSGQRTLYDPEAAEKREWFSLRRLESAQGVELSLEAEDLRPERRAFLHLKVLPGPEAATEEALLDYAEPFDTIRLHVIDTSLLNAISWRTALSFIASREGLGRGVYGAPLFYPARPSTRVRSYFLRDLAIEFPIGFANLNLTATGDLVAFPFLGAGVTWHEFVSAGAVFGLGPNGVTGAYMSIALLTRNGVFGVIPYEEIWKAVRQAAFSNKSEAPSRTP
jgi:hypothetical protein